VEERDEKTATDPEVDKGPKDGEIEAHKKNKLIKATDEASDEGSDDVELHRKNKLTK
jgi:hypothetical protein